MVNVIYGNIRVYWHYHMQKTKYAGWNTGICMLSTIHQQIMLQTQAVPTTNAWRIVLRQKLSFSRLGK